jgi:hypothetical protein
MTHDYKYEGESEEDKNSLIPPQYKKLESTNTQSDLTSSTGADKSGCICDDGFGMNLSCPVHHPTSSTQSPDLTQILDEIEQDATVYLRPAFSGTTVRAQAEQNSALVKALRRAIEQLQNVANATIYNSRDTGDVINDCHKDDSADALSDITAILNQGRKD